MEKIEDKLTDAEVPDSVLDLARAEMSKECNAQKSVVRKFNYKLVLSCAASLALCFAIILPVSLSLIKNKGNGGDFNVGDNDSPGAMPPAGDMAVYYRLQELDKVIIYPEMGDNDHVSGGMPDEPQTPDADTKPVVSLSKADYLYDDIKIIAEEKYRLRDIECTVYIPYDVSYDVDVLAPFINCTEVFAVGNVTVNYKIVSGDYFAKALFNEQKYYFTGSFAENSVFEEFCKYLFQ